MRLKIMLKSVCAASLFLAVPLQAQNTPPRGEQSATQQSRSAAPDPAKRSSQRRKPAASFSPSEKIRADTSVAFPADI